MTSFGRPRAAMLADVEAERLDLAAFLESLEEEEWRTPSLCPAWTVHHVLAHLTLSTRQPFVSTMIRVARARGDFHRVEADLAVECGRAYDPTQLIAQLRETAGWPHRFPLSGALDPLTDILVHGQDIARPLGRERTMPTERVVPVLRHVWKAAFYGARKRFAGLRFVATDADWSAGPADAGTPEARGSVGDILLLATGRRAGLTELTGNGVDEVAARMG